MTNIKKPVFGYFREKNNIEEFNFKSDNYKQAYLELFAEFAKKGVYCAILMGQSTYLGNSVFAKHWVYQDGNFVKKGPIKVDTLWVKDKFTAFDGAITQINSEQFRQICSDKQQTAELLAEFQPVSLLVNNEAELDEALAKISGDKVAIKVLNGNSGNGVFVGAKTDFNLQEFAQDFPLQVQEFIETNIGVPGIVDGRHDFRVIMLNNQPILATLRTPPADGFKSNLQYGGETRLIAADKIPTELLQLCQKIDTKLAKISGNRYYSADFGYTEAGWKLFEVNAMPGTINKDRGPEAANYQSQVVDFMIKSLEQNYYQKSVLGRVEKVDIQELGISNLLAKVDTGAYSSSIDCISVAEKDGQLEFVLFNPKHPLYTGEKLITTEFETTEVFNANGVKKRYVIFPEIKIAQTVKKCRLTLSDRSKMRYALLIGRKYISQNNLLVDVKLGQGHPDDEEERGL